MKEMMTRTPRIGEIFRATLVCDQHNDVTKVELGFGMRTTI